MNRVKKERPRECVRDPQINAAFYGANAGSSPGMAADKAAGLERWKFLLPSIA